MSRRVVTSVSEDFREVVEYLKNSGVIPQNPSDHMMQVAKSVHENSYSLMLWRLRIKRVPENAHVYLREVGSDALQVLPQILLGFSKTTKLLVRSVAENTLRHIYFYDHPIEYSRLNRDTKWYLTIEQLIEYAKNHPAFLKTEPTHNALGEITSIYSDLSAGVHGRRSRDLELRTALRALTYSDSNAHKDAEAFKRCTQATNFLLAVFNKQQMVKFSLEDRRAILHTMPPKARQTWLNYESTSL